MEVLRQGAARPTLADSADRAQVVSELSALSGDRGSLAAALEKQAQTLGSDAQAWARASEAWIRAQRPDQAEKVLTQALKLTPAIPEYLNQLAYARAYQGNVQGATAALDQYRKLRPGDPNALDSMGDVYYFNSRFVEASGFYREAYKLNPNFFNGISLLKAAYARLWTGDMDGAARTFEEYRRAREMKSDPATPINHAEFLFFSGKRSEGWQLLQNVAGQWAEKGQGPLASRAYSLAAIWSLVLGDAEKAKALAAKARSASGGSTVEVLSLFLTMPPGPAQEWIVRAQKMLPPNTPPAAATPLVATALVLGGHYEAALPYLDKWESLAAGEPGDFTNVLKAWVLYKLDRVEETRKLVQYTPLIPATGLAPVSNLVFPRIFFLRARLAEKLGKQDEAGKLDELFLKLSGDRDKIFGEEAVSRKKLGR
jgi:tetratricopeptide (TPR) repeat protein